MLRNAISKSISINLLKIFLFYTSMEYKNTYICEIQLCFSLCEHKKYLILNIMVKMLNVE